METLYKTTSEKQEEGTWKEIRVPLSAEEQALREKEIADYQEYEKNVLIPNQYKTDRVEGVYTLNDEGERDQYIFLKNDTSAIFYYGFETPG